MSSISSSPPFSSIDAELAQTPPVRPAVADHGDRAAKAGYTQFKAEAQTTAGDFELYSTQSANRWAVTTPQGSLVRAPANIDTAEKAGAFMVEVATGLVR